LNRHLNLNRHDTRWQQPVPAYRPASLANQAAEKKNIGVRTQFNNVSTFYKMYVAFCTVNVSYTNP
jgi:hypothetical protein